jgi:hypothetical protein
VTDGRSVTKSKDGGHTAAFEGELPVPDCVNTAMKRVQPASLDPPRCGALVEPGVTELFDAHHPVLP